MKKTLILIFITGMVACNKDKSTGVPGKGLAKIIQDNITIYEFVYSPQDRLIRLNSYDETTGLFDYAAGFEYDGNGNMVLEKQYNATNKLTGQVSYSYTTNGRVSKHEYKPLTGADSGKVTVRVKYSYDAAGRISNQSWVDLLTDQVYASRELAYYNNNNLRSSTSYYHNPLPEQQWKTDYTDGNPLPDNLSRSRGYPVNFLLYDMVTGQKHFYAYSDGTTVTDEITEVFTNRQYDDKGYLLQQTWTMKYILPAAPSKVRQMRYEYVQF